MHLPSILKLVTLCVMMSDYLMCCGYEAALVQIGQTAEEAREVVTHYCGLQKEKRTHTKHTHTSGRSVFLCHFFL